MDKTNVEDTFVSLVLKEAEKVEEKFAKGETLSSNDMHTLVLKTQVNHINHLDKKLDETVDSVKKLEQKFETIERKFENLEQKFDAKFETIEQKFETMEQKFEAKLEKAINTQTKWLISGAGVLVITMKLLDIFAK
jgi:Skp family chaperone for outer membrane proteins